MKTNQFYQGDALELARQLPDQSVSCIVTSPPYYGLRDYGTGEWKGGDPTCEHRPGNVSRVGASTLDGGKNHSGHLNEGHKGDICPDCGAKRIDRQIGLEKTPREYVCRLVKLFRELRRVLRDDGTVWLNIGDSYTANGEIDSYRRTTSGKLMPPQGLAPAVAGLKPKNLIGIPWRVAFALQDDGWILRSDIIWSKLNPMPESVKDRPTKAHEYLFLLSKSPRYWYDQDAIREPMKELNGVAATFRRNGSKREQAIPGQAVGTHRPDREDTEYHPSGRNKRSVWELSTQAYPEAHFAVFPGKLVAPCILAGCPHKVCAKCGAPWTRVTEAGFTSHEAETESQYEQAARQNGGEYVNSRKTIGWQPGCDCKAGARPGVVLDPFMGSGTVAEVAISFNRQWIGFELNPAYIELARRRIAVVQPTLFGAGIV